MSASSDEDCAFTLRLQTRSKRRVVDSEERCIAQPCAGDAIVPWQPLLERPPPLAIVAPFAAPRDRDEIQHYKLSAKMTRAKMVKKRAKLVQSCNDVVEKVVDDIVRSGAVTRVGVRVESRRLKDARGHARRDGIRRLHIISKSVTSNLKHCPLHPAHLLHSGFSELSRAEVQCSMKVTDPTVRANRKLVAEVALQIQLENLTTLCTTMEDLAKQRDTLESGSLLVTLARIKWDETQEKVGLRVVNSLQLNQQRAPWHVLVQRRRLITGIISEHGENVTKLDLRVPVAPLRSTTASALYSGLTLSGESKPFENATRRLADASDVHAFVLECDGASSNDKFFWHYMNQMPAKSLKAVRLCGNHGTHLIETALYAIGYASSFLGNGYNVAKVLRMHSYMFRLIASVAHIVAVREVLPVLSVSAPAEILEFNLEVQNFALANIFAQSRKTEKTELLGACRKTPMSTSRAYLQYKELWGRLMLALPFPWVGPVLRCTGGTTVSTLQYLLRSVVFVRIPKIPEAGKWAKSGPILDFLLVGICVHEVLLTSWSHAFSSVEKHMDLDRAPIKDAENMDEVDWSATFSKARTIKTNAS